jgi:hypothetical protein
MKECSVRLDNQRPGTSTAFLDAVSGEQLLQMATDEQGVLLVAYRLYDDCGSLVAESPGLTEPPFGLTVHSSSGDLLLDVPTNIGGVIQYRLYGATGNLLTHSDGIRTKIYPQLRMEGVTRAWVRHPELKAPVAEEGA